MLNFDISSSNHKSHRAKNSLKRQEDGDGDETTTFLGGTVGVGTGVKTQQSKLAAFETWNYIAVAVHFILFVGTLAVWGVLKREDKDVLVDISNTINTWDAKSNLTLGAQESIGGCAVVQPLILPTDDETFHIKTVEVEAGALNLQLLVISFFGLSAGFQLFAGMRSNYRQRVERDGENFIRFLEYSISASVMLVATALIGGITNTDKLIQIAALTFGTQILGLATEQFISLDANEMLVATVHVSAWVTQVAGYWPIISLFLRSVNDCNNGQKPPEFVSAIVWSQMFLFLSFGLIQAVQVFQYVRSKSKLNPVVVESIYIGLSLGAKTTLALLLYTNVVFRLL